MSALDYDVLFDACRELFGPDVHTSAEFLYYLQPGGIKSAYRSRAKETHPDHSVHRGCHHPQDLQNARFVRVKSAYDTLTAFLSQRDKLAPKVKGRQRSAQPRPHPSATASRWADDSLPNLPARPLQLGRYLYYRKVISFRDLLQAINWQRSARGVLGGIAREWGWMSAADVFAVLTSNIPGKFGEKAVKLGILDQQKLRMILLEQKIRHQRIGRYFVLADICTEQELDGLVRDLRLHNARFSRY